MVPVVDSGFCQVTHPILTLVPNNPKLQLVKRLLKENSQPLTTIFPKHSVECSIIEPGLLAGGAEYEGAGQLHGPGQGGEGGRCRGVEGVTEGEHWECMNF